jgi:hypothetical protein
VDCKLQIELLADHPAAIPILKQWFEAEWEPYYGPTGLGDAESDLLAYSNRGALPIAVVASYEDELRGMAAFKWEAMTTHAHLRPWATAGFVSPAYRFRGSRRWVTASGARSWRGLPPLATRSPLLPENLTHKSRVHHGLVCLSMRP